MKSDDIKVRQSAVADVVNRIRPSLRTRLGLSAGVIATWTAFVRAARVMTDDVDPRHVGDRFNELVAALPEPADGDWTHDLVHVESQVRRYTASWERYLRRHDAQYFLLRVLGESTYRDLMSAVHADLGAMTVAGRRALRFILPYAVAVDDAATLVKLDQRSRLTSPAPMERKFLQVLTEVDDLLEKILGLETLRGVLQVRPEEEVPLSATDFISMTATLRVTVANRARDAVVNLDQALTRKIDGARAVLESSPDGVSQASNSLIELIDRLLRGAFSEEQVLLWCQENYSDWTNMSFLDKAEKVRPTKLGQALCLAYAGEFVQNRNLFAELTALGLRQSRTSLQGLKHAERDDPDGRAEDIRAVTAAMAAIEGYLYITFNLTWRHLADEQIDYLRERLTA